MQVQHEGCMTDMLQEVLLSLLRCPAHNLAWLSCMKTCCLPPAVQQDKQ